MTAGEFMGAWERANIWWPAVLPFDAKVLVAKCLSDAAPYGFTEAQLFEAMACWDGDDLGERLLNAYSENVTSIGTAEMELEDAARLR